MKLNESLNEKYNGLKNKALLEKWDKNIKAVKEVYPKMEQTQAINLAIVLENTDEKINQYKRLNEGTQTADVGAYIRHAFELITGVMPNLVSEEVVSVQALSQKIGQIFFLKYVYGSNKGKVRKGETAFGPYNIAANPDYTSEHIDQEVLGTADGTQTTFNGVLQYGPVYANTVEITLNDGTLITDNGAGKLISGGAEVGTINYNSGAYTFTLATAPEEGTQIDCAYDYSLEYAPTQAPEFNMEIVERIVTARPRRLRTNYSFGASYDVEKQFGLNMDDELLEASVMEIKHEIDQEILNDLKRQAGLTHSWNITSPKTIQLKDHYASFLIGLNEGANLIFKKSKRAKGNVVICGYNAQTVIESLDAFIPSNASDKIGAYLAGTIKGQMKVIVNPFYGDDDYVIAYKGKSFLDAGYVYAPYLPVFATQVIMLDDFVGRRGYATSYAKAMLNPDYYVRGTITHNPAALSVDVVNTAENPVNTKEVA